MRRDTGELTLGPLLSLKHAFLCAWARRRGAGVHQQPRPIRLQQAKWVRVHMIESFIIFMIQKV
jgi:hypothetical protein